MPIFTVYIAASGSRLATGGTSKTGHMWFSITKDSGPEKSYGFAPAEGKHGLPHANGAIYKDDVDMYLDKYYKKSVYISYSDYEKVENFGERPTSVSFGQNPFTAVFDPTWYDGGSNSCIDFTWRALNLLKRDPGTYEGSVWPTWNISEKLRILLNEVKIRNAVDGPPGGVTPDRDIDSASFFGCFIAGTEILIENGLTKHIEEITLGDLVASYRSATNSVGEGIFFRRVTKTFINISRTIINLRGLHCTPGHVFLTTSCNLRYQSQFAKISNILNDDKTIVDLSGTVIRARTGAKLGSSEDAFVKIVYDDHATVSIPGAERRALVRAGIPMPATTLASGAAAAPAGTLAGHLAAHGITILPDGSLRTPDGTHHAACNWPEGATPFDSHEARNWIVEADGRPYTPPWIRDLVEEDDTQGMRVVGALQAAG